MALFFAQSWGLEKTFYDRALLCAQVLADTGIRAPLEHITMLRQDLVYASRSLVRAPGFTAAVIATLALAIGANTTMFSVVYGVLLRPLALDQSDRLVRIWEIHRLDGRVSPASFPNFESWRAQVKGIELGGFMGMALNASGEGEPERINGAMVSPAVLHIAGARPLHGRLLYTNEESPNAENVVLLSERIWRNRYGANPQIIGSRVSLNGSRWRVVGILPASFNFPDGVQAWIPLPMLVRNDRGNRILNVIGRLKPGVTVQQADAEMNRIAARLEAEYPAANRDWKLRVDTFYNAVVPSQIQRAMRILFGAVTVVLLIACANVANLLLARALTRRHETAIRLALGAGRRRIMRQLLTESGVLSVAGCAFGLAIAAASVVLLRKILPDSLPRAAEIALDVPVLGYAVLAGLVSVLLFGVGPAWRDAVSSPWGGLRLGARASEEGSVRFARSILVAGQLALTTVLLVGAGLFSQSFLHLQRARLGFDPDRVFTSQLSLVRNPPIAVRWDFYQRLLSAIESSPGIVSASISTRTPLTPGSYQNIGIVAAQASTLPVGNVIATDWRSVSPHYFDSLRIPLLSGRTFSEEDLPNAGIGSAILNQSLANRLYPATDPHGRLITLENRKTYRIVGVVGDTLNTEITAPPPPTLYLSATQEQRPTMFFAIRTRGKPETALPILKECLKALDPKQALAFSRPLSDWVDRATEQPRLQMWLFGAFSTIALILAAIGIYGVISYSVSQRTAEIGVRMAVGASTGDIVRMVLGQASRVVAPGLAAGVGGALAMSQLLSGFLYGIQPRDPATLLMAPLVLGTLVSWSGDSGHPNRSCPRFTKLARDGPSG